MQSACWVGIQGRHEPLQAGLPLRVGVPLRVSVWRGRMDVMHRHVSVEVGVMVRGRARLGGGLRLGMQVQHRGRERATTRKSRH